MTGQQLAAKIRENALALEHTGSYSVEADALIVIAANLADLADHVAALEGLARTDIGQIIDGILEGRQPPPVNQPRKSIALPEETDEPGTA